MIASANEIIELPMESFEFDVGYVNHWGGGGGGKLVLFCNKEKSFGKAKKKGSLFFYW